jgi:hypothetical protein
MKDPPPNRQFPTPTPPPAEYVDGTRGITCLLPPRHEYALSYAPHSTDAPDSLSSQRRRGSVSGHGSAARSDSCATTRQARRELRPHPRRRNGVVAGQGGSVVAPFSLVAPSSSSRRNNDKRKGTISPPSSSDAHPGCASGILQQRRGRSRGVWGWQQLNSVPPPESP